MWPVTKCFEKTIIESLKKDLAVSSEDTTDIMFVGHRLAWKDGTASTPARISVNQNLAVEAAEEITFDKKLNNDQPFTPQQHTAYRSVLGQINWLQNVRRLISAIGLAGAQARPPSQRLAMSKN